MLDVGSQGWRNKKFFTLC